MDVKAINSISSTNFEGKTRKQNKQVLPEYPQQTDPASRQSAQAMRNLVMGLMLLGASAGSMTSCTEDATASASATATATATVIGGGCNHRDTVTIIKPDTIFKTDTIIHTIIKPIHVKDYPFNLGDSLIAQGQNIGIPIDGPKPDGSGKDNVVYIGSKAHNRYDNKFYESAVDSVGTNRQELAIVTKVVDMYDDRGPKVNFMKTIVSNVPGRGIKLTRYVADTDKRPGDNEQYLWNYAGYEVRSNGRDGKRNTRSIFDNNNRLVYRGDYERGQNPGTFLYGSLIYDPETGKPVYDDKGEPEFAQYDFDQAVIYSDYAKTYTHDEWQY